MNAVKRKFDEVMSFDGQTGFRWEGGLTFGQDLKPVMADSTEAPTSQQPRQKGQDFGADTTADAGVSFLGAALGMPGLGNLSQAATTVGGLREETVQPTPSARQAMQAQAQNDNNTRFNRWELSIKSNRSSFVMLQGAGPKPSDSDGMRAVAPVAYHHNPYLKAPGLR